MAIMQGNSWLGTSYIGTASSGSSITGSNFCSSCGQLYRIGSGHNCDLGSPYYVRPQTREERDRVVAEQKKREEEVRLQRLNWKMSGLDNDKKKEYLDLVRKVYRRYELERRCKQMMSGIKWFFIFLGFAVLVNFQQILDIIKLALGEK